MATIKKLKRKKGEAYQLNYTDPTTGKRYRKTIYCDHNTAVAIRKETEARLSRKQYGIEHKTDMHAVWSDITKRYLIHSSKTKSVKTTKRESLVLKTFSKFIGNPDIHDITLSTLETFMHNRLKVSKVSPATVSIELRVLKTLFNQAIKWEITNHNPVKGLTLPRQDPVRVRYLLIDEVGRLLEAITDNRLHRLALVYLNTGARRSELLPPFFTWQNIDFKNKVLNVIGKGNIKRYIPMNKTVYSILKSIKDDGAEVPFEFRPDTITHKFHEYYKEAGIVGANVHSLRKTFGSLLLQNGKADLYTVSKMLGHASIRTTEKYYVDLLDENYHSSVKHLEDILPIVSCEENA